MNYNYVFILPEQEDLVIRYSDLNNTNYTKSVTHAPDYLIENGKLPYLHRIHMSARINKIVNLPFKNIWNRYRFFDYRKKISFNNDNPICFIIYARYFCHIKGDYEFIQHLRIKYDKCKIVLHYTDLLSSYSFNVKTAMQYFDVIISFDKKEASNNNFFHYDEQFFSVYDVEKNLILPQSDVVFIGKAKNRLNKIINIFELLCENNINCNFHITEVPISERKYTDKISYHSSPISYYEILQYVISSKCILEILQDGGCSHTARVSEAIYYGKKILSNCQELITKPYYNPEYISMFLNPEDIDVEFLKNDKCVVDYNYKQNLSPLHFIDFVENCLVNGKIMV